MVRLNEGDKVDCHIKDGAIVSPGEEYDEMKTFEIVSTDNFGYYLYVPHYIYLRGTSTADVYKCRNLGIDSRFLDEQVVYITEGMVGGISRQDGMCCFRCKDFFRMAEVNQP